MSGLCKWNKDMIRSALLKDHSGVTQRVNQKEQTPGVGTPVV